MDGSAADRHDVLNLLVEEAEEHRDDQRALVKRLVRLGRDPTAAEAALREAKDILLVLRTQRKALEDDQ